MVVRQDRRAVVRRRAVRPKKPSRACDRVSRVPDVRDAVAIPVGRVSGSVPGSRAGLRHCHRRCAGSPRRAEELHRPRCAGRIHRSRWVASRRLAPSVVALDLADRGQDGPVDAEAQPLALVKREVGGRDVGDRCGRGLRLRVLNSWAASAPRTEISSTNAAAPARTSFAPDRVEGAAMLAPAMGATIAVNLLYYR